MTDQQTTPTIVMTHSPLPWIVLGSRICDANGNREYDWSVEERAANRVLVCRAVNAHDALVAALRDLLGDITADPHLGEYVSATLIQQARAALALVEVK